MAQVNIGPPIGIDLGTAFTRAGVFNGNGYKIILDDHGNGEMPSYVAFTDSGVVVGEAAKKQELQNPANTVFDIMRLIGRRYSDPSVQNDMKWWPFKVVADPNDKAGVEVFWKGKAWKFYPEEILSMILKQLKENSDKQLGITITNAVVAIPVCFNYEQRHAVRRAGFIAGLHMSQLISAPAAVGLFYNRQRVQRNSGVLSSKLTNKPDEHDMLVFDLGAGTFDVSVISLRGDVCQVRATAGDINLGGKDIDKNLAEYFFNLVKEKDKREITNMEKALIKFRRVSERAKTSLSSRAATVPVEIKALYNNRSWENTITRVKFNELNKNLFLRCMDILEECLKDAKINRNTVNEVILAGGSTRIPMLQTYLGHCFKNKELNISKHLQMAATYGASIQAFLLCGQRDAKVHNLSLLDVMPFSLGIQTADGVMAVLIPKNTSIPTTKLKSFHAVRNGSIFNVEVYEGEGISIRDNNFLGKFELSGFPNSSVGCDFRVCFELDVTGALTVTAEETYSKVKDGITIIGDISSPLAIEASQRRVHEALYKEERENGANKAPATMIPSETGSLWRMVSGKNMLSRITSLAKGKGENTAGQSSNQNLEPQEYAIGIDFGTTYSSVGVWRQNGVKIIDNEYGKRLTNSCVAFTEAGRLIGDSVSKEQVTTNPANAIYNIKRLIGRDYSDIAVTNDPQLLPYRVSNENNRPMISVQYKGVDKHFAPEEISSMVLTKMKEIAEAYLGLNIKNAVVGVPACFSGSQRKSIKDAGIIAGLDVMQLINEPTAAAIAYFLQKDGNVSSREKKNVLVFDLGGGILDVSIFTISGAIIEVQAVVGDMNLGGETFDDNMVNHFVEHFLEKNKKNITDKPRSLRRLRTACEKAKRVLSTVSLTMIEIDALYDGIDFHTYVTKENFEKINAGAFERCIKHVAECLKEAKMDKKDIHDVILVGGSTRIPRVQLLLQEFFDNKELCKSINQDEAVAYGAAVLASILSGNEDIKKFRGLKIKDVTALPLALNAGEAMNVIFPKSTSIPITKELIFTTSVNDQTTFTLNVHESDLASMSFTLSGIPPEPRCYPTIPVIFEIDANGILNLKTRDESSKEKSKIIISKNSCGFNEEEIQKMVEHAKVYIADDEEHKKKAARLNSLESWAYKMKEIARTVEVFPEDKEHIYKAANDAIIWLEAHHDANIDEIDGQIKILEHINDELKKEGKL